MTEALRHPPSNYINGTFLPIPGDAICSHDPAMPDRIIWEGNPEEGHLDQAIKAATTSADPRAQARVHNVAGLLADTPATRTQHLRNASTFTAVNTQLMPSPEHVAFVVERSHSQNSSSRRMLFRSTI